MKRKLFRHDSKQDSIRHRGLFLEPLENRHLLATIAGIAFDDLNANGQRDITGEVSVPPVVLGPPGAVVMSPNDDGSTGSIDLGFTFEFYGESSSTAYINNNGNITFSRALSSYTPSGFPQSTPIIAPFWADVDTRGTNAGSVHMSRGFSSRGNPYFQVDWIDVGYYSSNSDKLNDFSLYLEDDPAGDIVAFFYRNMEWTTGDASSGSDGFGGTGAQIGFDSGNSTNYISLARPRSASELVPFNETSFRFRVNPEGTPDALGFESGIANATIYIDQNDNGQLDSGEPSVLTSDDDPGTALDETGMYQFDGVPIGQHVVRQILPAGYLETTPTEGFIRVDIDGDQEVDGGHEFGRFELASVAGRVVDDTNGNGLADVGEPGRSGATIFLDANQNGVHDQGEATTQSDINGQYLLEDIVFGQHQIRLQTAGNQFLTSPTAGYFAVSSSSGSRATGNDFLTFREAGLAGLVYHDVDQNGVPAQGDQALAGWTVYVDANDNGVRDSIEPFGVTNAAGQYGIASLPPGPHIVRAVVPGDWEAVVAGGESRIADVVSGQATMSVNFGFAPVPAPRITSAFPAPGAAVATGVDRIELHLDRPLDPATAWLNSVTLIRSGGDGTFTDGNEVLVEMAGIELASDGRTVTVELDGFLPRESYRFIALDDLIDGFGHRLDGEWNGSFPTGDGQDGGSFELTFSVTNAPPVASSGQASVLQTGSLPIVLSGSDVEGDPISFRIVQQPAGGTLTAGASSAEWTYTPDLAFAGQDRIRFVAHDGNADSQIAEVVIAVASAPTDLQPLSLSATATTRLAMGEQVLLQWSGRNNGPGTTVEQSPDWRDRVYLSFDNQLDSGDLPIANWSANASPLVPGASYNASTTVTLPLTAEYSGDVFLLLEVDAARDQLDTNVDNNVLAQPIRLDPIVHLSAPYAGQFVDSVTPLLFTWQDVAQGAGQITFAIDSDADPTNNAGHTVIASGLAEDPDDDADRAQFTLPDLPNGEYYVWARIDVGGDSTFSTPIPVQMVDQAYVDPESLGDAVGGGSYEVHGVELGRIGEQMLFRVRTNYNPGGRGGDIYLNIGGSYENQTGRLVGLAVNDRVTSSGATVQAGDLYLGATFDQGTFVPRHPTFIRSFEQRVSGQSSLSVENTSDRAPWRYEITGSFPLDAIGTNSSAPLEVTWAMYCGNDIGVIDTGEPAPDLVGGGFSATTGESSLEWGADLVVDYAIDNIGDEDAEASAVSFFLSVDGVIDSSDIPLQAVVSVPAIPAGSQTASQITLTLPDTAPDGFLESCGFTIGMIVDVNDQVAESNEDNNRNLGEGLDLTGLSIGGVMADQGIDRWFAERGEDPFDVTWTVCIGVAGEYSLDIDIENFTGWDLTDDAEAFVDNVRVDSFGSLGGADLGTLDVGLHEIRISAFEVPDQAVVAEVTFQLDGPLLNNLELNALFVADHPTFGGGYVVEGIGQTFTAQGLAAEFAPVLHYSRSNAHQEDYDYPFSTSATWQPDVPRVNGSRDDSLDLGDFAPPVSGSYPSAVYAAVLPGSTVNGVSSNELAINYYFHYPRSNWGEVGGHNTHEGDWEGVTLFFSRSSSNAPWVPYRLSLAQHIGVRFGFEFSSGGMNVPWNSVVKEGSRPVIFVGMGAHASYPGPGATPWSTGTEHHHGNLSSVRSAPVVALPRASAEQSGFEWLLYPGHWGSQDGLVSGCASGSNGPRGPVFFDSVCDPDVFVSEAGGRWLDPWDWARDFPNAATVGTVSPQAGTVEQGDDLTLAATAVTADPSREIQQVVFYREDNSRAGLQTGLGGDSPIASDSNADSGWNGTLSTDTLSLGNHTFYAIAQDDEGFWGPYAATDVTIALAPTAVDDQAAAVEDTPLLISWESLFTNDSDTLTQSTEWVVASVNNATNGSATNDPDARVIRFDPQPNFFGTASFTYELDSGTGLTDEATVTLQVASVNDLPTAITLDGTLVSENTPGAVIGPLTVTDDDADDTHTFSLSDNRFEVVDGNLRLAADAFLDFEVDDGLSLLIIATDPANAQVSAAVTIHVRDEREAPTNITLLTNTVAENEAIAVVGKVQVTDPDEGDSHALEVIGDERFEIRVGYLALRAGWLLDRESSPTIDVQIEATDLDGLRLLRTVTVEVLDVNEPPTGIVLDTLTVAESSQTIGGLTVQDPDVGDSHSFTVSDNRFEVVGYGLRLRGGESLDFETEPSVELTIAATDSGGFRVETGFTLTVTDANDAPTVANAMRGQVPIANVPWSYTIPSNTFADQDQGDTLTYTASVADGGPLPEWVSFDESTNRFHGTPDNSHAERDLIRVTATDRSGASQSTTFELWVILWSAPWQNPINRLDVNARDGVAPVDALYVINYINAHPGQTALPDAPDIPAPFYDVNGDNLISSVDVLVVVNHLNSAVGEGEATTSVSLAPILVDEVVRSHEFASLARPALSPAVSESLLPPRRTLIETPPLAAARPRVAQSRQSKPTASHWTDHRALDEFFSELRHDSQKGSGDSLRDLMHVAACGFTK